MLSAEWGLVGTKTFRTAGTCMTFDSKVRSKYIKHVYECMTCNANIQIQVYMCKCFILGP